MKCLCFLAGIPDEFARIPHWGEIKNKEKFLPDSTPRPLAAQPCVLLSLNGHRAHLTSAPPPLLLLLLLLLPPPLLASLVGPPVLLLPLLSSLQPPPCS